MEIIDQIPKEIDGQSVINSNNLIDPNSQLVMENSIMRPEHAQETVEALI